MPTKETRTKVKTSGLSVMAPTKEPTQETAEETKVETLPRIVETVTPGVCKTPHFKKIMLNGSYHG